MAIKIRISTRAFDLDGNVVTSVEKGDVFVLKALVQDLRSDDPKGLFAVYTDISYSETPVTGGPVLSVVAGTVTHPSPYENGIVDGIDSSATEIPALGFNNSGGMDGMSWLDGDERAYWAIQLKAEVAGEVSFTPNRDNMEFGVDHHVLLFNANPPNIPESEIEYSGCTLNVVSAEKARVRLDITDEDGNSLSNVNIGDDFYLRGYVKDIRAAGANYGVFEVHTDVTFDSNLIKFETDWDGTPPDQAFTFYEPYNLDIYGLVKNEYLDDVGAQTGKWSGSGLDPHAEYLVYSIKCTALAAGNAQITPNMPTLLGRSANVSEPPSLILLFGAQGFGGPYETLSEVEVDLQSVSFTINDSTPTGSEDGVGQCVVGYWQHGDSTNAIVNPWDTLKLAIKDLIDGSSTSETVTISYSYMQPFIADHVINNIVYDAAGRPGGAYETNTAANTQHYDTYFLGDGGQSDDANVLNALQRSEHDVTFRGHINIAFQQWKELFEDLWPGLTLNFVDLGLETGTPPPTSVVVRDNFYNIPAGNYIIEQDIVFPYQAVGDIRISMHRMDGTLGVLAHTISPLKESANGTQVLNVTGAIGGDLHFDLDGDYRAEGTDGVGFSILYIAAHEIGHALGLGHDSNTAALMGASVSESIDYSAKIGSLKNSEFERAAIRHLYGRSLTFVQCSGVGAFVSQAGAALVTEKVACNGIAQFFRGPVLPKVTASGSGLNFSTYNSTNSAAVLPSIASLRFYATGNGTVELPPVVGPDAADLRYRNRNNVLVYRHGWGKTGFERLPDATLSCSRVTYLAPYTTPTAPTKIAIDDICGPDKDKDNILDLTIKAQKLPNVKVSAAKVKAAHDASLQKMGIKNIESQNVKIANSAKPKKKNKLRSKL